MSERLRVEGGKRLLGELDIQGSKNAALPMIAAALLHEGTTVLTNVPHITDVDIMVKIMEATGCICYYNDDILKIDASAVDSVCIEKNYVGSLRSSVILLGALLSRMGRALTYYPGGCSIGRRPIDYHLSALQKMGAVIIEKDECIDACVSELNGAEISLPFPSVGATENIILAAVRAKGTTIIHGAAGEPEITALCDMLNSMGADIHGSGTDTIYISGVLKLNGCTYKVPGDRIVAGTYMAAVMAVQGDVLLKGIHPGHLNAVIEIFGQMGAKIKCGRDTIRISIDKRPAAVSAETDVYPGFPTDMQSQLLAVLSVSEGNAYVKETVFEGRFATALELKKFGADIELSEDKAEVKGKHKLIGVKVTATDLRGGAALVIAGLAAEGTTYIDNCFYISRGYEDICRDLSKLGGRLTKEY